MKHFEEAIVVSVAIFVLGVTAITLLQSFSPDLYNQLTGKVTVGTTLNITPVPSAPCNFTLYSGMNLVSFFCVGDYLEIETVLSNLTTLTGVFGYQKGAVDSWKAYNPNLPIWVVNDLTHLDKKQGYWIRMNATEGFYFQGILSASTDIPITAGYNLVGYPDNESDTVPLVFQTINGSYSKVVGFDPVTKLYHIYVNGTGGTLNTTDPNRGYWINATASDTWTVS